MPTTWTKASLGSATSFTERTATATSWTEPETPAPYWQHGFIFRASGQVRVLFDSIVLDQPRYMGLPPTFTERTG